MAKSEEGLMKDDHPSAGQYTDMKRFLLLCVDDNQSKPIKQW